MERRTDASKGKSKPRKTTAAATGKPPARATKRTSAAVGRGAARAGARLAAAEPPEEADEAATDGSVTTEDPSAKTEAPEVGEQLRRVRAARGMSLEALAKASGVSRAMLSQIELGRSTPTIKVLWKVAHALSLPFSALIGGDRAPSATTLLRADKARRLTSHDGRFSSRALFPVDRPRQVEFYELRLAPGGHEDAEAHPAGTLENLVVHKGALELRVGGASHRVGAGDAIQFQADVPHTYRNEGAVEAVMYLVMTYPELVTSPGFAV